MRLVFASLIFTIIIGCSTLNNVKSENLTFKETFFEKIENVEKYVKGNGNRLYFKNSLDFLSKYVKVSHDKMLNYSNSYTTKDDFLVDKRTWLEWYEKKKCNNIQLK